MKTLLYALLALGHAASSSAAYLPRPASLPDLPPDAAGWEYARYFAQHPRERRLNDSLSEVLNAGERNLSWLERINEARPDGQKLSLSSKENARGYPIDQPSEYNPPLVRAEYDQLKASYPADLAAVAFGNGPLPATFRGTEAAYLDWSNRLDRVYQSAARWRAMQGSLPYLETRRTQDIRGYYFLSRMDGREAKLRRPSLLSAAERANVQEWLTGMCINQVRASRCPALVNGPVEAGQDLNPLYDGWVKKSASVYEGFFRIVDSNARKDFTWETLSNGASQLITPFTDPGTDAFRHYLQANLEDEWHTENWALRVPFTQGAGHPHLVFQTGALPHANRIGGDEIVMNKSQPLTEYDAQWTIRHEFGHILGFPDCYVEFYVPERQVIVNYQIDTKDIMCSRLGHIEPRNVSELRRVYGGQ